jgi:tRNA (guanine26-N2/guanine27-N2)-dimethyltransferase
MHALPTTQFDVVDLDPYGSVSPFLNGAMGAVKDGGIVLITCTDMAVLGGNQQDVCYTKYGAAPVKGVHVHEQALRIVLASASRCRRALQAHRRAADLAVD